MALDEFVEAMLVRPLKVYARKQTTVSMLQKINMNLGLLQHVQKVFKKSFDIHPTSKHTKQDSTPDIVKVACLQLHRNGLKIKEETTFTATLMETKFCQTTKNQNQRNFWTQLRGERK